MRFFIVALLLVNATISYVEESNADRAIKALTSGEWLLPAPAQ